MTSSPVVDFLFVLRLILRVCIIADNRRTDVAIDQLRSRSGLRGARAPPMQRSIDRGNGYRADQTPMVADPLGQGTRLSPRKKLRHGLLASCPWLFPRQATSAAFCAVAGRSMDRAWTRIRAVDRGRCLLC